MILVGEGLKPLALANDIVQNKKFELRRSDSLFRQQIRVKNMKYTVKKESENIAEAGRTLEGIRWGIKKAEISIEFEHAKLNQKSNKMSHNSPNRF